jgi:hypothetical protein
MRLFSVAVAATMASPVAPEVAHFFEHRGRAFRFHAKERVIRNLLFSALRCGNNLSLYLSVIKYRQAWTFGYPVFILSTINNHLPHFATSATYLNYSRFPAPSTASWLFPAGGNFDR